MLDQNQSQPNQPAPNPADDATRRSTGAPHPFNMNRSFDGSAKFIPVRSTQPATPVTPLSVSAPRSAAITPPSPAQQTAARLTELLSQADSALPRLESALAEEHAANARAQRLATDMEERLKLGVRMLQAFDVQSERGERIAGRAVSAIEEVERILKDALEHAHAALQSEAERVAREKVAQISSELDLQRDRVRELTSAADRIARDACARMESEAEAHRDRLRQAEAVSDEAANERLGRLMQEVGSQLERLRKSEIDAELTTAERIGRLSQAVDGELARFGQSFRAAGEAEGRRIEALVTVAEERFAALREAERSVADTTTARLADASAKVDEIMARASSSAHELERRASQLIEENQARLERELGWRFERVKEVEARIEQAANTALVAVDAALGDRLSTIDALIARAEVAATRVEAALSQAGDASAMIERSERAMGALAGLSSEATRVIDLLAGRVSDASALREVLGRLVHELAAAREVVHGDMRRMRDDLGWLAEKSERLTGELVDRADRATAAGESIRAATDAAAPLLDELRGWAPMLSDPPRERLKPLSDAIASGVRSELAREMQGFSKSLRQLASSADATFKSVTIETDLLRPSRVAAPAAAVMATTAVADAERDLARSFVNEIARLGPVSTIGPDTPIVVFKGTGIPDVTANPPFIATNRPLELDA